MAETITTTFDSGPLTDQWVDDQLVCRHVEGMARRIDEALTLLDECRARHGFLTGSGHDEFHKRVEELLKNEGWL